MKKGSQFCNFLVRNLFKLIIIAGSSMAAIANGNDLSQLKLLDLRCEYATDPIGLDTQSPQFSWRIESEKRGAMQSAYQIMMSDSPESLSGNTSVIWNSDTVRSSESTSISYKGPDLKSRMKYYWKVRIWDTDNRISDWSEPASFEMGLINQEDWLSEWIGFTPGLPGRVLYFRGTFKTREHIQKARAYISGIGYYKMNINGLRVGDNQLDPATSDYNKHIYYTTYDIGPYLKSENSVVVAVGPGWYGIPKLRMQIEFLYKDGTTERISSDFIRNVTAGPILRSSIYDGEAYDAREESGEFDPATAQDSQYMKKIRWTWANIVDSPGGKMISQKLEPIKIISTLVPQDIKEPVPGVYVVDAGQNLAGWASLKVRGERGTRITMKFSETLYRNGTVNQENLRSAESTDTYILKGSAADEIWEPSFTYHGFRYIQVEGFPYRPEPGDIEVKIVRSSVEQAGKFSCSNELLNRIHKMVVSTEASNLHSIPTDCPQRDERQGWLNDLTVRMEQALYNFDLSRFYSKFITDVEDTQDKEGRITCTAPYRWGYRPADPVSASYLLLAFKSYEFYGNMEIIRQHYAGLKAWVDYLNSRTVQGIVDYSYYGDWSPPVEFGGTGDSPSPVSRYTPGKMMSTGYLYYCASLMSRMAEILKNEDDRSYYKNLAEKTALAFNKNYWDEKAGGYASNNQASNSFALYLGLVPKNNIERVAKNLAADVKAHDYHLTTGNLCTKYLLEMLTENGYPEVAFKIATQKTYPSWGFMLENGATTLWERWEYETGGAMNSHNHPMMGSVDSWFYRYILGIKPDIGGPGFAKFTIHPYIINELNYAEGEYNSVKGVIRCSWKKESGSLNLNITVPENSIATVFIPAKNVKSITESGQRTDRMKEIKFLYSKENYAVYTVCSGSYKFKSDWIN
jgi:alpha-L-rhamnosidase